MTIVAIYMNEIKKLKKYYNNMQKLVLYVINSNTCYAT